MHAAVAVGAGAREFFVVVGDKGYGGVREGRAVRNERTTTSRPVAPEKLCNAMSV
jgi:hypothetical protein